MATLAHNQLQAIWAALNDTLPEASPLAGARIYARILDEGVMHQWQLEEICFECDPRLIRYGQKVDLAELSRALGYHWEPVYNRPRVPSNTTVATTTLPDTTATALLLKLEQLGFAFDPGVLVEKLRPAIARKRQNTGPELDIFWADRSRGKAKISLVSDQGYASGGANRGRFANGSQYEVQFADDGSILSLTVKGPKYRGQTKAVETVCAECGTKWLRGDPDSSAAHRKEHRNRLRVIEPEPLPEMIEALAHEKDPELVSAASPRWKHAELQERARAFMREQQAHGLSPQPCALPGDDPGGQGFLLTDAEGNIVGALAFRRHVPVAAPRDAWWCLQWVWICPRVRRSGVLSSRWAALRKRFGEFVVEGPVSDAMKAFLTRHGDERLLLRPMDRVSNGARAA